MHARYVKSILCVVAALFFYGGCVQAPLKVTPIAKTEHPAALVDALGQGIAAAGKAQVDVLSPSWFAKARESHAKARDGLEKGIALNAILDRIAMGNAQLERALTLARKSNAELPNVIKSRDAAIAAGAEQYTKAFSRAETDFLKLTRAIEADDTRYAQRRKKGVDDQYRALELQAIKEEALGEIRRLIEKAQALEMDQLAPKSFLIARTKLDDADRTITRNRYDDASIAEAVEIAGFYAERMLRIGATVSDFKEKTAEDIVLWSENQLSQINVLLDGPDYRHLSFEAQQAAISDAIATLKRNRSSLSNLVEAKNMEINRLNQRISHLEGRTYQERVDKERLAADKERLTADTQRLVAERERLAAEKRFNQLYTRVQGYFSADLAEVYKQAHQLVIRLKAMQFPVGKADIEPGNYSLLATVQEAIVTFGQPDVTIEGHTDSTGSDAMNQELSRIRAEAVRQYLISNGTLPAGKISAIGFGSSRPLASNATSAGRAVNRRIDVIIKPMME